MDITKLDTVKASNAGADLELLHPATGEKTGVTITLAGPDSDVYRKALRRQADRQFKTSQKRSQQHQTAAELEEEAVKVLAACTLDWQGMEEGKDALGCTPENVEHVYRKYLWIREQVDEFVGDRQAFIKA